MLLAAILAQSPVASRKNKKKKAQRSFTPKHFTCVLPPFDHRIQIARNMVHLFFFFLSSKGLISFMNWTCLFRSRPLKLQFRTTHFGFGNWKVIPRKRFRGFVNPWHRAFAASVSLIIEEEDLPTSGSSGCSEAEHCFKFATFLCSL